MSSMQLRNRAAVGGIGARKSTLASIDENAIAQQKITRASVKSTSAVLGAKPTGAAAKTALSSKSVSENQAIRAALGDLSNKVNVSFYSLIHLLY